MVTISVSKILSRLGSNIRLARLRRKFSTTQVSERAGINRATLWQIEKGSSNVSIGSYAQVLFVLGLEKDLLKVAEDDILGRKLQDAEILLRKRAPKLKMK
jgi:transcriptional regulator with XRE-family HTH domain